MYLGDAAAQCPGYMANAVRPHHNPGKDQDQEQLG